MKTVIVFGATGDLGTYLVDELFEQGYKVIAVSKRNIVEDYYNNRGIECFKVDISRKADFKKLPTNGIDAAIHLSGAMPSRMEGYNSQLYIDVNTTGTLNILEYCRSNNIKQLLFTQSHSDVAGYWNTGEYIKPDAPRKLNYKGDHTVYIISKNAAVDLIEHYHQQYGLKTYILRLPTVYNYRPVFDMFVDGKAVPLGYRYLIQRAIQSEQIEIWGDPSVAKDIVYVKDFNQLVMKAMESGRSNGIYNVGTGVPTSLDEQIKGIVQVFSPNDKPSEIIYRPEKPSQNSYLYDIDNARLELGYEPKYDYIQMLKDMKKEMEGDRFKHLEGMNVNI
jgi:UDP-glucose 4-epimerase